MTHYNDGRRFEYKVRDALTADGYEVIRSAGSKGKVDLVAFKDDQLYLCAQVLFVQCKRTDGNIGREDRVELLRLARMVNAYAIVAHRPAPRRPIQYRRLTGPGSKDWVAWSPDEAMT